MQKHNKWQSPISEDCLWLHQIQLFFPRVPVKHNSSNNSPFAIKQGLTTGYIQTDNTISAASAPSPELNKLDPLART
jgi:hypothetical protein